jgi:chromosome partitioning protein
MTKVISLFNHKGGVSKTTTVFHLGWKMARLGKRVLIVDADPQCNLTGLSLGLGDYDALFKFYDSKQNTDVFNSLAPVFEIDSPASVPINNKTAVTPTENPNLFVLAGNIRFSEIDIQIATALTSSGTIPVLRKFVGAFNYLIRKAAREHNIDIVIVDMSPSVSATNQCILMSSDYFIVPISPDFYCYQAIDSLSNILPKWADTAKNFRDNSDYSLPKNNPKMLGLITQNYRVYTTDETAKAQQELLDDSPKQRQMSKAYRDWLEQIKSLAAKTLVPALQKYQMIVEEDVFKTSVEYDEPYHLAGVQNFNSLIPVSQKHSKPIYELTEADGQWSGATWSKQQNGKEVGVKVNIDEADQVYRKLAESVIAMID